MGELRDYAESDFTPVVLDRRQNNSEAMKLYMERLAKSGQVSKIYSPRIDRGEIYDYAEAAMSFFCEVVRWTVMGIGIMVLGTVIYFWG